MDEHSNHPTDRPLLRRVWKGTGLLVLGRLWGSACTLAILFVLARHLEASAFGRFTFYLAAFALLDSLTDLGTGSVAVQRTADDPGAVGGVLRAARRIRVVSALSCSVVVAGGAFAFGEPGAAWIAVASLYPLTHALELSATVFRNRIAWGVPVAVRAGAATVGMALVWLGYDAGIEEPALFLLAVATGSATANVALHLASRRHLPRACEPAAPWRPLLAQALPLGIAGLCQQAYFYVDNVFVRAIAGPIDLGHYNVGVRIMSYAIAVAVYASLAALPWLTREHAAGRLGDAVARLLQPLLASAGLGVGLCLPWTEQVLGLFGPGFGSAASSLRWLLLAAAAVYAGSGLLTALVATGKARAVLAVSILALGVNLVGNTLLVGPLGIEGAAIATLATELCVVAGALAALVRAGVRGLAGERRRRWLAGALLMAAAAWVSARLPVEAWLQAAGTLPS
ncbi:MAG: oligosaccharide flippase family protein [Planctomycetota bacterium]|jgi:O-antigen/teichoic acid export membrane protein|nr:oligosaccharide flippase family protein [Planctomycetota bacterium]MDP6763647.1 oligosaccharide flippase family protein [Planctomycetota bacterium]MDP6990920.1 oligosaccharide flippase family protein [Planctomycetota bacterium]